MTNKYMKFENPFKKIKKEVTGTVGAVILTGAAMAQGPLNKANENDWLV